MGLMARLGLGVAGLVKLDRGFRAGEFFVGDETALHKNGFEGLADTAFVEGPSYYRRLRMYRGELAPDDLLNPDKGSQVIHDVETIYATQGYGVGNWYLYNGELGRAYDVFTQITQGRSRFAFGYIAAELELRERVGEA